MSILLKTIGGSHLYGTSHADSDEDWMLVESGGQGKIRQTISPDGLDVVIFPLSTFLLKASQGTPQSLEMMFSRRAETMEPLRSYRRSYVAGLASVDTYRRTIKNFHGADRAKSKRHALRLAMNLRDLMEYGRFDPTLSDKKIEIFFASDRMDGEEHLRLAEELAGIEL